VAVGREWCNGWEACARPRHKRNGLAHRFAYECLVGPIPDGMHVLHKCDVRCCVNPQHLFLGTNADNIADRVKKGRSLRRCGEAAPTAKLTQAQVNEIRRLLAEGMKHREIAALMAVTMSMVAHISAGRSWRK
jgi:hypothetical protein